MLASGHERRRHDHCDLGRRAPRTQLVHVKAAARASTSPGSTDGGQPLARQRAEGRPAEPQRAEDLGPIRRRYRGAYCLTILGFSAREGLADVVAEPAPRHAQLVENPALLCLAGPLITDRVHLGDSLALAQRQPPLPGLPTDRPPAGQARRTRALLGESTTPYAHLW